MKGFIAALTLLCAACGQPQGNGTLENSVVESRRRPPVADATSRLFLAGDGLELVDPRTGISRFFAFGSPEPVVRAAVEPVIGQPEEDWTDGRCRGHPWSRPQYPIGLTLTFVDGRFLGWDHGPITGGGYRTRDGITSDMTRARLMALGGARFTRQQGRTNPGEDFTVGAIEGALEDGTIINFHAGEGAEFGYCDQAV